MVCFDRIGIQRLLRRAINVSDIEHVLHSSPFPLSEPLVKFRHLFITNIHDCV